jgi:hypothetical protein
MLPPVVEHVDERVAHLAWSTKEPGVKTIHPDASVATERTVDGFGDADGESLEPAGESHGRVRFDEQVQMVPLDAEVNNAETHAARGRQGATDGHKRPILAKRRKAGDRAQRHVCRTTTVVGRAAVMRHIATAGGGLAPGAASATSPGPDRELQLSRRRGHLKMAAIIAS